jgi:hypothetical protein
VSLKPNIKALGLAFVAVLALGAIAASAAQASAPHFTVAGSTAFGETTFTGTNSGSVTLTNPSRNLILHSNTCTTSGIIKSSAAGVSSTFKQVTLSCTNVEVTVAGIDRTALCPVHSPGAANGTITTKDTDGNLVWMEATGDTKVGMTFTPEAGVATPFTELEITGVTCPLATGATPLKVLGNAIATNDSPTTVNVPTQKIEFTDPADTDYWTNQTPTRTKDTDSGLTLGGTGAIFKGTFNLVVAGDNVSWGVEPG